MPCAKPDNGDQSERSQDFQMRFHKPDLRQLDFILQGAGSWPRAGTRSQVASAPSPVSRLPANACIATPSPGS